MLRIVLLLITFLLVPSCGEPVTANAGARILLLGDSMMASNRSTGQSVSEAIERHLGQGVIDRSVVGARYFFPLPLAASAGLGLPFQVRPGPWETVVLNGGGNDLLFGCGCGKCGRVLDRLISADGKAGAIPGLVARLRATGAKVIYVGYLRSPGSPSLITPCRPAGTELDKRLALMAARDKGTTFLPMSDLVPFGDRSLHQIDRIHPSAKGSQAIADRIVRQIGG